MFFYITKDDTIELMVILNLFQNLSAEKDKKRLAVRCWNKFSMTFGVICYLYSHFGEANSMLLSNTRNHLSLLTAHYSKLKNLWSSVASVLSACNYWVMSKLTANVKKHKNPPQWGGFYASKGLILPLKTPFLGLFWGTFTGFYKNTKSYFVEY